MTASGAADVTYIGFLLGHGGDALQMLDLANGIQGGGARVRIIVPELESTIVFQQRCAALGIDCERTPLITASMHGSRQRLPSVVRLLRCVDSEIVHFHTGNSCLPMSVMASLEALRYRRAFTTLQSPYETITAGRPRARLWASTARRRFHAVISPSDHGTAFQRRCGVPADLAVTVRNSIHVDGMAVGDGAAPRAQLGIGPDVPLVVFGSRIDPQKRPVDAVRIFAGIADEFPTAVLAFLGQGELETEVAAEAARLGLAHRIRLMGYQTNVPSWLAASTVWILPTERENFSVAVLEALAAGCVVLSTSCRGNDEVLVDGENASVFPVGDVDEATTRLRRLLSDPSLRTTLSAGARLAAQPYTVANMVAQYRDLYARSPSGPFAPAERLHDGEDLTR